MDYFIASRHWVSSKANGNYGDAAIREEACTMDQGKIWAYFQGKGVKSFDDAIPRLHFLLKKAKKYFSLPSIRVLNIGIGNGWLERECLGLGWSTCSLDPDEDAVRRVAILGVDGRKGSIEEIPFEPGNFQIVFCSEVLEHLHREQLVRGISEIGRVLAPGGYLIGSVPYNEDIESGKTVCPRCGLVFHRWGHHGAFTRKSLNELLCNSGFKVTDLGIRTFLDFSRGTPKNKIGLIVHWLLGILGSPIATPVIYFIAHKKHSIYVNS